MNGWPKGAYMSPEFEQVLLDWLSLPPTQADSIHHFDPVEHLQQAGALDSVYCDRRPVQLADREY